MQKDYGQEENQKHNHRDQGEDLVIRVMMIDNDDNDDDDDDGYANLFRHMFDNSGTLGDAVSGALLLRHHIVCHLVMMIMTIWMMMVMMIRLMTNLAMRDMGVIGPCITISSPMSSIPISTSVPEQLSLLHEHISGFHDCSSQMLTVLEFCDDHDLTQDQHQLQVQAQVQQLETQVLLAQQEENQK